MVKCMFNSFLVSWFTTPGVSPNVPQKGLKEFLLRSVTHSLGFSLSFRLDPLAKNLGSGSPTVKGCEGSGCFKSRANQTCEFKQTLRERRAIQCTQS